MVDNTNIKNSIVMNMPPGSVRINPYLSAHSNKNNQVIDRFITSEAPLSLMHDKKWLLNFVVDSLKMNKKALDSFCDFESPFPKSALPSAGFSTGILSAVPGAVNMGYAVVSSFFSPKIDDLITKKPENIDIDNNQDDLYKNSHKKDENKPQNEEQKNKPDQLPSKDKPSKNKNDVNEPDKKQSDWSRLTPDQKKTILSKKRDKVASNISLKEQEIDKIQAVINEYQTLKAEHQSMQREVMDLRMEKSSAEYEMKSSMSDMMRYGASDENRRYMRREYESLRKAYEQVNREYMAAMERERRLSSKLARLKAGASGKELTRKKLEINKLKNELKMIDNELRKFGIDIDSMNIF